jgi:hypothetical protein
MVSFYPDSKAAKREACCAKPICQKRQSGTSATQWLAANGVEARAGERGQLCFATTTRACRSFDGAVSSNHIVAGDGRYRSGKSLAKFWPPTNLLIGCEFTICLG